MFDKRGFPCDVSTNYDVGDPYCHEVKGRGQAEHRADIKYSSFPNLLWKALKSCFLQFYRLVKGYSKYVISIILFL